MKLRKLISSMLILALLFTVAGPAFAAQPAVTLHDLSRYGDVIDDRELEEVEGELDPVTASGIVGAAGNLFHYLTSPGEKSLGGALIAAGEGALLGMAIGATSLAYAASAAAPAVVKAGEAAINALGAAIGGALTGALRHLYGD